VRRIGGKTSLGPNNSDHGPILKKIQHQINVFNKKIESKIKDLSVFLESSLNHGESMPKTTKGAHNRRPLQYLICPKT